ncbi:MAG: Uncharacterized protein FD133_764 [Erysipelotrichaceae bacterium]|nr:MAG: hypothetical protein FD179_1205 [Erysipelotrichaceae bacterium]TXT18605.1 MAG: Uncharacterized protein FD133_764 [Erysipelotrichaceae bacterium]
MKINEVIAKIKAYHKGIDIKGNPIDETTTRDKILYGDSNRECTGIITTCFASTEVIINAIEKGANLIISHEALFWNHGDHTDWLADNQVFLAKKKLLEDHGIVVWRDHDYIHSGIPMRNGDYTDGIFYGLMKVMNWDSYLVSSINLPILYEIPKTTLKAFADDIMNKIHLSGIKVIGDPNTEVKRFLIGRHIMGPGDNEKITEVENGNIDVVLSLEVIDYTVSEYIRDASQLGWPKAILAVGHFNLEEPGMAYMIEYLPQLFDHKIPCAYVQSGDSYHFFTR